jgi:hypothetical protein
MGATAQTLIKKIEDLPPQRLAEVEDFVDFLKLRDEQMRARAADQLFGMMDKLAAAEPQLTPEEIQEEIEAARTERREKSADRS